MKNNSRDDERTPRVSRRTFIAGAATASSASLAAAHALAAQNNNTQTAADAWQRVLKFFHERLGK